MRERRQIRRFFDDHALIDIIVFAREDLLVLLYRRELWDMIYFVKIRLNFVQKGKYC